MTVLPFIDAHHHLWDLENNPYPWLQDYIVDFIGGDYAFIRQSFLIKDLLAGAESIPLMKSAHVQAVCDLDDDSVKETAWLQGVADNPASRGMPHAIVGYANLAEPNVEETLVRHAEHQNWRGIRDILNWSEDLKYCFAGHGRMQDRQWRAGYRLLSSFRGWFDLQV